MQRFVRAFSNFASRVAMIEPVNFKGNLETAQDNKFMNINLDPSNYLPEFHNSVKALRDYGIDVVHWQNPDEEAPDCIFPNNWFSTHGSADGKDRVLILYPLKYPSRQRERRKEFIQAMEPFYDRVVDLSYFEKPANGNLALESTGVLIFDRKNFQVFMNVSDRASPIVLETVLAELNKTSHKPWTPVLFTSTDKNNYPVYHTNVVMGLTPDCAVVTLDSIKDASERSKVEQALDNYKLIPITQEQTEKFCGNLITLYSPKLKDEVIVMSEKCRAENLPLDKEVVYFNIDVIETIGGGSARCMIGELF